MNTRLPKRKCRASLVSLFALCPTLLSGAEIVSFPSGQLTLKGILYKPDGDGPFPAVLFNHGSGQDYGRQIEALGPVFTSRGWVFFAPYRRGQGLSASAGPYIVDQMNAAEKAGGTQARSTTMVRLLETDHFEDQMATLVWLRKNPFVAGKHVAVAGNSFGGIQAMLGAERGSYCAAVNSAGAAQTWESSPDVQSLMLRSARNSKVPVFFFPGRKRLEPGPQPHARGCHGEGGNSTRGRNLSRLRDHQGRGSQFRLLRLVRLEP